jgi:HEAT repeat protein
MRSNDFALFPVAMRTAQEMPGPEVTRLLADQLPSLSPDRQILLIQTLACRADPSALPALFAAAQEGGKPVRLVAIRAIAEFGNGSALPIFVGLLGDGDKEVAAAAQEGLGSLPGRDVDAAIIRMLADGTSTQRMTALELIARRRITSAIPTLFDAAAGSDPQIRTAAIRKLGELADPSDLPRLFNLLAEAADPGELEATEQAVSSVSLRALDPGACVRQVEARLAQAPPAQKCALVRVLGAVGGTNALTATRAAVNDPNTEVHGAAIRVLAGWSTAEAAPDLLELAKAASNPTDKMICLRGYLRLAGQSDLPVDKRLAMCREAADLAQKDNEKKLLLGALGGIASPQALNLITPYLDDAGCKEEAATAVVDISDKLLQRRNADWVASRLIKPLEKAVQATANGDLANRANGLLDQAKSKAGSSR